MSLPARRLAPALAVVALGLSACGGDEPTPAPSSSAQSSTGSSGEGTTSSPGSSSSTASSRAQRELTQAEVDALRETTGLDARVVRDPSRLPEPHRARPPGATTSSLAPSCA